MQVGWLIGVGFLGGFRSVRVCRILYIEFYTSKIASVLVLFLAAKGCLNVVSREAFLCGVKSPHRKSQESHSRPIKDSQTGIIIINNHGSFATVHAASRSSDGRPQR